MIKLVGYQRKQGIYENKPFDNHNFFVVEEFRNKPNTIGSEAYTIKVKNDDINFIFGFVPDEKEIAAAIGNSLDVIFDKGGKPEHISFHKVEEVKNGK